MTLRVGPETLVRGHVADPQDVTTVLGNLIDNAVSAAVAGSSTERWVEVELLDDAAQTGGTLHLVVGDSGDGLRSLEPEEIFAEGFTTSEHPVRSGAGHGLGLALVRQLARRRGGDVRVLEPGTQGGPGAVFMATIPGVRDSAEQMGTGADSTLREDSNG